MEELQSRLIGIFSDAQNGLQYHKKKIEDLRNIFHKSSLSLIDFFEVFFELVKHVLICFEKHPATERLVGFIAKFAVSVAPKRSKVKENDEDSSSDEDDDLTEVEIMNNFTHLFLMKLISNSQAQDKAVRFRSALIIARILDLARNDPLVKIHYTILDDLMEQLMSLLYDRIAAVRVQAALALSFYQDPTDPNCPVTNALSWSLVNDSSSDVRKCLVKAIILTKNTFELVIGRTRDVSEEVRKATYYILAEKCTIRHLRIEHRIRLMNDGLKDRSTAVKNVCLNGLLRSWLLTLEGDVHELLRRLDLESSPDVCDNVLMNLFEELPDESLLKFNALQAETDNESPSSNETIHSRTIPYDNLEPEIAFYWKGLCKYFKNKYDKTKDPKVLECLESVAPTLSNFCEYLENCFAQVSLIASEEEGSRDSQATNEFILCELCGIIQYLDFSDEVGKRHLGKLVHSVITSRHVPPSIVSPMLLMQKSIWPRESFRVEKMLEIISEVRYPSIPESSCQNNMSEGGSTITDDISRLDLKEDNGSLLKCLAVATEIFGQLKIGKLSPSLQTLVESLLFPCIKNENPYVRDMAVNALGRACLVDIELARNYILLFIQVCFVDFEIVKATALKAVFDLLHLYGLSAFSEPEEQPEEGEGKGDKELDTDEEVGPSSPSPSPLSSPSSPSAASKTPSADKTTSTEVHQKFLHILGKFLDENSPLLRGVAVEGLSKLLLCGRLISVKLLTRLFIMWYNPTLQKDTRVRGVLGAFFSEYAACGQECHGVIAECFLPLLKTIFDAPESSPLCKIDVSNLMLFVLKLSAPANEEEDSAHDSLAISVANFLLSDDEMSSSRTWCQMLCKSFNQMTLTKSNKSFIEDMIALIERLQEDIEDRSSRTSLKNFKTSLRKTLSKLSEGSSMEGVINNDNTEGLADDVPMEGVTNNEDKQEESEAGTTATPSHIANIIASVKASSSMKKNRRNRKRRSRSGSFNATLLAPTECDDTTTTTHENAIDDPNTEDPVVNTTVTHETNLSEDDDEMSLLGEHSPFVKTVTTQSRSKKRNK